MALSKDGKTTAELREGRRLLQFKTYEDYLDHLVTEFDTCYLQNTAASRQIAELGYRSAGETLNREQFEKRLKAVIAVLYPPYKPYELHSEGKIGDDPLQKELSIRERPNRIGLLATIIFVRYTDKSGVEISGYIDYAYKLTTMDWRPFFQSGKLFQPNTTDLSYMHWKRRKTYTNDSPNFKTFFDDNKGLLFQSVYDRVNICVDPEAHPGTRTTRKRIHSKLYPNVILYDHVLFQTV